MLTKGPRELIPWLENITGKTLSASVLSKGDIATIKDLFSPTIIHVIDYKEVTTQQDKDREIFPDPSTIWKKINDT
jgi:hypothetical protein